MFVFAQLAGAMTILRPSSRLGGSFCSLHSYASYHLIGNQSSLLSHCVLSAALNV
jgi:hypothetical protein